MLQTSYDVKSEGKLSFNRKHSFVIKFCKEPPVGRLRFMGWHSVCQQLTVITCDFGIH